MSTRYYNPDLGRFLNADALASSGQGLLGNNMFVYCNNNASNCSDSLGTRPVSILERFGDTSIPVSPRPVQPAKEKKIEYNVPLYNQENYHLCWAFCETMMESYYNGVELSLKQAKTSAIRRAIKRNTVFNWNSGGWPSNLGDFCEISNIGHLYELLYENGPVYALYSNNAETIPDKKLHLVIVTGVDCSSNVVYTNNPWYWKGEQTFEDFVGGVAWDYPNAHNMTLYGVYLINQ